MLWISEDDVRKLLPMSAAIALMRGAFLSLADGTGLNQPRRRLALPTGAVLHALAGASGNYFGTKVYATHPRHGAWFLFLLFDAATARPLAILEANWLGQIRTGATTGFATDLLARRGANTLGVIGTGFQASSQVEAVAAVRPLSAVRVWSRSEQKRSQFAASLEGLGLPAEPRDTAEEAIRGADLVVTATHAKEPVLEDEWIGPGTHINAVGSNVANRRELPGALVRRADRIAVDDLEQARLESGDLIMALSGQEWTRVRPLKDLAANPPARADTDITLFKSNGLGIEDVAAGAYVYERARAAGAGKTVPGDYSWAAD